MKRHSSAGRETHNDTRQQYLDRKTHSLPEAMTQQVRAFVAQAWKYQFKYTAPRQKLDIGKGAPVDVEK